MGGTHVRPILHLFLLDDLDAAQVLTQNFGNYDGTVSALILLHDCGEDTGSSQTGAVQSVNEVQFAVGTAITAEIRLPTIR